MKKVIVFLVIALVMLCVSCSSGDSMSLPTTSATEITVKTDSLASLQANIAGLKGQMGLQSPETRGWLSRLFRRILADAVGGLWGNFFGGAAGAVVGAASFSACCVAVESSNVNSGGAHDWVKINDKKLSEDSDDDLLSLEDEDANASVMDSIGYYHNQVLRKVADKEVEISEYPKALLAEVRKNYPNLGEVSSNDSVKIVSVSADFLKNEQEYEGGEDIDVYAEYLESRYSSKKGEIMVVKEFLDGLPSAESSNVSKEYVQQVLDLIDASSLSIDLKQSLRNGVLVGEASNRLWNVESPKISTDN